MQAMRRHAHNILAALLCMCLLISYTPLPASAAEGEYAPSVSDELGSATPSGDGEAQMSTTVSVLTIPALAITRQTEDYAAKIDEIKAHPDKYDLKVAVTGEAPFTYEWTRTIDGKADESFSYGEGPTYPLSQHTDTLEDGHVYAYTVTVGDKSGKTVQAVIKVTVSSAYSEKTFEGKDNGVSVTANAHYAAVFSAAVVDARSETYRALQLAADGATIASAWQLDLTGAPEGLPSHTGSATVSLPAPTDMPDGAELVVVGLDASGSTASYEAVVQGGKIVFAASALGAFAVAWKDPVVPPHTITASVTGGNGQIDPSGAVEVADGASQTFTFRPDDTYVVDEVLVDNVPVSSDEIADDAYTFQNVTDEHAIVVSFKKVTPEPQTHAVSARVEGGNGKVSLDGAEFDSSAQVDVEHGAPAKVSFLPDTGYVIDAITVAKAGGEPVVTQPTSENELTLSAVEVDTAVVVTFKSGVEPPQRTHTVTATSSQGGSIAPASVVVPHGGSVELTVTADAGYRLKALTIDGDDAMGKLDGTTLKVPSVLRDTTVHAEFEPIPAAFHTVMADAGDGGAISPAGQVEVVAGTSLTYYLHPDEGFLLKSLMLTEGGGAAQDVTDRVAGGVFVLDNVQADCVLAASFEKSGIVVPDDTYYAVNASASAGGAISPAGTVRVKAGGSQVFHFLPEDGYKLASVTVDGQPIAVAGFSYALQGIAANATIAATFEPVGQDEPKPDVPATHAIAATSTAGGTVSPTGDVQVPHGGSMSFAFIPYAGYELDQVQVDGQPLDADAVARGAHRFDNVTEDGHTVHAVFKASTTEPVEPDYYALTVEAGVHGTAAPAGTTRVAAGATQTLYAFPDEGYVVDHVMVSQGGAAVDRASDLANGTTLALAVTADTQVNVSFRAAKGDAGETTPDPKKHTLTSSASAGGTISPLGAVEVAEGGSLAYTVAAEEGYHLSSATVGGATVAVEQGRFTVSDVRADQEVRAIFEADPATPVEPTYRTIHAAATDGGSISPAGAVRVASGKAQTFYFYPSEGHALEGVYVDETKVELADDGSYTFASVQEDASIEARFRTLDSGEEPAPAPTTYTMTASASTGGTVSPAGDTRVVEGGNLLLTFTPDAGCRLKSVLVDGAESLDQVMDNTLRFTGVTANHTVRAVFECATDPEPDVPARFKVTASTVGGGAVSPAGETMIASGASQTFSFTPDEGKKVASLTVNGTEFAWSALSYTLANVSEDTTLEVSFVDDGGAPVPVPTMHTVTAAVDGGHGSVSPAGDTQVADRGSLTLTFTPDDGFELFAVTVGGEDALGRVSANGSLRLNGIEADVTVTAAFSKKADAGPSGDDYRTVSASAGAGGSISPAGDVRVARGASQSFTLVPDEGKRIESLTLTKDGGQAENVTGQLEDGVFMLEGVQSDCTLHAEFVDGEASGDQPKPPAKTCTVTAFGTTGGTVSPSGATTVAEGSSLTLTFTPDAGYELSRVMRGSQDVTSEARSGVYVLENIAADETVEATFSAKQPVDPEPAYHIVGASVEGGHGSVSPAGDVRVKDGASQTFLFIPDAGYVLDQVKLGNAQVAPDGYTYTVADVQADTKLTVSFREKKQDDPEPVLPTLHQVTANASAGGTVSPAGSMQVAEGTAPLFTIAAESGYQLESAFANGTDVTASVANGTLRLPPVTADVTLTVTFERVSAPEPAPADPVVTATAGAGGSISPAGAVRVARGASQTFSLIPDADHKVKSIKVGDGTPFPFAGTSYTLFDVQADTTVRVEFEEEQGAQPPAVHTVSASATAGGEIVPEGDVTVTDGSALTVSFAPYAGYELYRVALDGEDLPADQLAKGFYRFANVKENHSIRAYFALEGSDPTNPDDPDKPTGYAVIDASVGEGGSIAPSGQVKVLLGGDQTFRFAPDEGYRLDEVLVNGESVDVSGLTYTFENVRAAAKIRATFVKDNEPPAPVVYAITASATSGGTIDPSGRVAVDEGGAKTFAIAPDEGFELASLLIDGKTVAASEAADGSYTFANVQANHTIRAVFQLAGAEPVEPVYTVVHAAAGEGGTISPAGDVRVEKGGSCSFVMLPYDGYKLDDVTVDGRSAFDRVQDNCRLALDGIDAETTVRATFAPLGGDEPAPDLPAVHTVRATSTSGGAIAPRGAVQVVEGEGASFAVTPDEGYVLAKLVVDGEDASADLVVDGVFSFADVRSDHSVRAVFERIAGGPAPEEPPYANVDVQVQVKVSAESVTNGGGTVRPEFLSVLRGTQNIPFYVYPEEGHDLEAVEVNGEPVPFYAVGEAASFSLMSRASVFSASAPGAAGAYWFTVDEANDDLVVDVTFRKLADGEQGPAPVQMHRVDASAAPGGLITPDGATYVHDGGQAVFSVVPDAGYRLSSLMVTEGGVEREAKDEVANGLLILDDVRGDVSVRASFEPEGSQPVDPVYVTVHATAGEHGTVSPAGDVRVKQGGSQTFAFVPDDGYTLDKVYVNDGETTVDGFSLTLDGLTADTDLHVTFKPAGGDEPVPAFHDVTVSAGAHGRVWPSGVMKVEDGASLSLLLQPDNGYEVASVKVNGVDAPASAWADGAFVLGDVTGETRVEVTFAETVTPTPGKVLVTATAGEHGAISPSGSFEVSEGSNVRFTFVPEDGYAVDAVTVNGKAVEFEGLAYTLFEVGADTTIHVTFKEEGGTPPLVFHTITATAGLHGTIDPKGAISVAHGYDQRFEFSAESGYVVDVLTVDGVQVENPGSSYLFENVEGDHAIGVTFRAEGTDPTPPPAVEKFVIAANVPGGHGSVSPVEKEVVRGKSFTFQFEPDTGYRVSALSVDGASKAYAARSYTFEDVQANHTLEVTFSAVAAPAPVTPLDTASRAAQKAVGYVKTGDANGVLAVSALALAAVAGAAALAARRRVGGAAMPQQRGGRGGRR